MGTPWASVRRILRAPVDDYTAALTTCLTPFRAGPALAIVLAFALTWWAYVPIHELLHAAGCVLTGGSVSRLEIDPVYGAALLQRVFPYVTVGSTYAGQLTGFDTHGSDLTYLATDFLPFTLTICVGIPLLQAAGQPGGNTWKRALMLGAAMPIAYAPFISITGDYYEMGSVMVTHVVNAWNPAFERARWRSDDLVKLVQESLLPDPHASLADVAGIAASFFLGLALIFATYQLGILCARWWLRPRRASQIV